MVLGQLGYHTVNSLAELLAEHKRLNSLIYAKQKLVPIKTDPYDDRFVDYFANIDTDPAFMFYDDILGAVDDALYTKRILGVARGECCPTPIVPLDNDYSTLPMGNGSPDKFRDCNWSILNSW